MARGPCSTTRSSGGHSACVHIHCCTDDWQAGLVQVDIMVPSAGPSDLAPQENQENKAGRMG